jgi:hypothetical protein
VAGRPLRPATRRRLGRPLPHQQADRPRAHPRPSELSSADHAAGREYPVLAPVSRGYPRVWGRLPTCYAPVRRSPTTGIATGGCALDLHVLGTPPAFVLSQDQTLRRDPRSRFPCEDPVRFLLGWPRRKALPLGRFRSGRLLQSGRTFVRSVKAGRTRRTASSRLDGERTGF